MRVKYFEDKECCLGGKRHEQRKPAVKFLAACLASEAQIEIMTGFAATIAPVIATDIGQLHALGRLATIQTYV
jgi:hypothetical protein